MLMGMKYSLIDYLQYPYVFVSTENLEKPHHTCWYWFEGFYTCFWYILQPK